ncbi:MAG: hypothetical protein ACOCPQ_00180 [Desulfosudaceae bacterium]
MSEYSVTGEKNPVVIGATGVEEVLQNVRSIITTLRDQVPLDRGFARTGRAVDSPVNKAAAAEVAELFRAISRHEPRAKVLEINFSKSSESMDGELIPVVRIQINLDED